MGGGAVQQADTTDRRRRLPSYNRDREQHVAVPALKLSLNEASISLHRDEPTRVVLLQGLRCFAASVRSVRLRLRAATAPHPQWRSLFFEKIVFHVICECSDD